MSALTPILEYKRSEVDALKRQRSLNDLDRDAKLQASSRGFIAALNAVAAQDLNALICELKRKSPSAGEILPGADPVEIAMEYEAGGAACLSVLTDGPSFGGSLEDLQSIRAAVQLPILRKDFMIDPVQIIEARAAGADAILIIMAAVDDTLAKDLLSAAKHYGMDALVEVHNEAEMERALALHPPLIGINNRDLAVMKTDLSVTERLSALVPGSLEFVAESGIKTPADISRLRKCKARRYLIGESLMLAKQRKDQVFALRKA